MDLRDVVHVLRRRWRSIVSVLGLALIVAGALTFRAIPQYESSAQLFISTAAGGNSDSGATYLNGLAATQKAPSYAKLVTQSELTTAVVDRLKLDMTPAQLAAKLQGAPVTDSALVRVSATDPDPAEAQRICRVAADVLRTMIAAIETPPRSKVPLLQAKVTDAASLPTSPSSPNLPLNLGVAGLLGLLLGMALALTRDRLDTSVRTHADIEETISAAVLGTVAHDSRGKKGRLIEAHTGHQPLAEAFRVLRTNLQFVDVDTPRKALVVTSAVSGEGKTTAAANLALSQASAGLQVLLVDADLRRPRVAEMLGLEGAVGVTTVLLRRVGLADAVQRHQSGLHVLASGSIPPNPAELLQSRAMAELLDEVRSLYDIVVIDSPPLLPVTDAALLAAQTDGALLVIRFGKTTRDQIAGAMARIDGVGGRLLGAVVNGAPARGAEGYGYGYGYAPKPGKRADSAAPAALRPRETPREGQPEDRQGTRPMPPAPASTDSWPPRRRVGG